MKTANLRDVKQSLSRFVKLAQSEQLLILKHGQPAALVIGVEGHDMEDLFHMTDPKFWKMLKRRRKEKAIDWSKAKKH